eukprot:7794571-Karenia_brevis.AAC.1
MCIRDRHKTLQSSREFDPLEDEKKPLEEHCRKSICKVKVGCDSIAMLHARNAVQPTDRINFHNIVCKISLRYKALLNATG